MKKSLFEITENAEAARNTFRMRLKGDTSAITAPGQFVNVELSGFYLRRPISVCHVEGDTLTLFYKVVGGGTKAMSGMAPGTVLDVLSGLGNGFDTARCGERPLLVGGGAGVAPLYLLAVRLIEAGKKPCAILGFNTADEVFLEKELRALGVEAIITTADGSRGVKGFVTDALAQLPTLPEYHYCCGPEPMLRAVYAAVDGPGQYSFEERMGCGFGACMGCSCRTKYGTKRICRDGPVLEKEEIVWEARQ